MSASDERTVPDAKTEAGLIEDPEHVPTRWYSYVCTASRASDPHRTSGGTRLSYFKNKSCTEASCMPAWHVE